MSRVKKTEDNLKRCECPKCPTYKECGGAKLFCSVGKAKCPFKMNGCLCYSICPVHKENKLTEGYFCIHGSADEIE